MSSDRLGRDNPGRGGKAVFADFAHAEIFDI
jgi:hypothetical protein